jgi:hypothetical protein
VPCRPAFGPELHAPAGRRELLMPSPVREDMYTTSPAVGHPAVTT